MQICTLSLQSLLAFLLSSLVPSSDSTTEVMWIQLGRGCSSGNFPAIEKDRSRQRRLTVDLLAR